MEGVYQCCETMTCVFVRHGRLWSDAECRDLPADDGRYLQLPSYVHVYIMPVCAGTYDVWRMQIIAYK